VQCGIVTDFVVSAAAERALNATLERAAKRGRFRLTAHRLDALGTCDRCR
jgi:uncharacterized protein (DUF1778 family)